MSQTTTVKRHARLSKNPAVAKAAHVAAKVIHGKSTKGKQPYGLVNGKFDATRESNYIDSLCVKDDDPSGMGPLASAELAILSKSQFSATRDIGGGPNGHTPEYGKAFGFSDGELKAGDDATEATEDAGFAQEMAELMESGDDDGDDDDDNA